MKRSIILSILIFIAGFFTHAFIFPDTFVNGLSSVQNLVIPNLTPTQMSGSNADPLITKVEFDGQHFSKHNVTIGFTRYIQIVNTSATQKMELFSNDKSLITPRAYAESEAIQAQCNQKGQFVVIDRNNPNEKLILTVK